MSLLAPYSPPHLHLYREAAAGGGHRGGGAAILQGDVLDDGKAKTRAAQTARAALVDAVETLEEMGEMMLGHACAVVGVGEGVVEIDDNARHDAHKAVAGHRGEYAAQPVAR